MVIFYKKWKKYNEIQLTKNKMDLNIRKTPRIKEDKETEEVVKKRSANMERSKEGTQKEVQTAKQQLGPAVSQVSLLPEVMDEVPNELNLSSINYYNPSTTPRGKTINI